MKKRNLTILGITLFIGVFAAIMYALVVLEGATKQFIVLANREF